MVVKRVGLFAPSVLAAMFPVHPSRDFKKVCFFRAEIFLENLREGLNFPGYHAD